MKKRIIAAILTLATLWLCAVPTFAREEEFISEVALVYEDSVEDAREAIKGTNWKLYDKDLNPNNANYWINEGVYLIYKTTTNVEEAITDLRVMDMYGGYSISDYERQLAKSREQYGEIVKGLRVVIEEFKSLYAAGDAMAQIAYRQMNYYRDVKTAKGNETDKLMGDFFLDSFTDDQLITVLMEGNSYVASNLISLLAIGVSGTNEKTLATRIKANYDNKDSLGNLEYYDSALTLSKALELIRAQVLRYDTLSENYTLTDEEMSEEEFTFVSQYASLVAMLDKIMLGTQTLTDIIRGGKWTVQELYPIVAALSEGQIELISLGQLSTVLKYADPSDAVSKLNEMLDDAEAELKDENGNIAPVDVYVGVDRSVFDGACAFTNEAERAQALNGETWGDAQADEASRGFYIAAIAIGACDVVLCGVLMGAGIKLATLKSALAAARAADYFLDLMNATNAYKSFQASWALPSKVLGGIAIGLALIAAGLSGISYWYNYYNPDYTEIPATMVDVRETDLGDKYVKYTAAGVFGDEDGRLADFNAYQGKEWIALYYTKDATAGNCLTPNFKLSSTSSTVARRYQGVNMFGETKAFDLNSHVYNDSAESVYLSVRYSNTKKAAADVPDVVGTMLGAGGYALAAGLGLGVGMGIMGLIGRKKKQTAA